MMVNNPCCFAMSVRSIGSEDYYIALVVGKSSPLIFGNSRPQALPILLCARAL